MRTGGRFTGGRFTHSSRSAPNRDPRTAYGVNGLVPEVVGDFKQGVYQSATASGFDALFTFARATVGSYTNSNGILSWAAAEEPRIDHRLQNGQWINCGVLLEGKARTNLLIRSAGFAHSSWSKTRASIVPNDELAPDRTLTASRLISTALTYDGAVRQSAGYTTGQSLSFSVYAKAGDRDFMFLRERTNGFAKDSYFDLRQGVPGTVNSVHTAEMQDAGNGWFRCAITVRATRSATSGFEIYNSQDDLNTASAQPGFIHIWGAQLEVGASPSSYIETQDSPAIRAADLMAVRAAQVVDPMAADAISIAIAGDGVFAEDAGPIQLLNWSKDANDRIGYQVATDPPTAGRVELIQTANGSGTTLATAVGAVDLGRNAPFAISSRHTGAEIALSSAGLSGALVLPSVGQSAIGLGPDLMGHIAMLRLWAGDIGPAGLQST